MKCDHTYESVIKRIAKKGYVILDETGSERTIQCCVPGVTLKTGDRVLVKIPNGNLKQSHISGICGKTSASVTATQIGSSTVGNDKKPVYINNGIPTECNSIIGSASVPVYVNSGTITACTASMVTFSEEEPLILSAGSAWIDA